MPLLLDSPKQVSFPEETKQASEIIVKKRKEEKRTRRSSLTLKPQLSSLKTGSFLVKNSSSKKTELSPSAILEKECQLCCPPHVCSPLLYDQLPYVEDRQVKDFNRKIQEAILLKIVTLNLVNMPSHALEKKCYAILDKKRLEYQEKVINESSSLENSEPLLNDIRQEVCSPMHLIENLRELELFIKDRLCLEGCKSDVTDRLITQLNEMINCTTPSKALNLTFVDIFDNCTDPIFKGIILNLLSSKKNEAEKLLAVLRKWNNISVLKSYIEKISIENRLLSSSKVVWFEKESNQHLIRNISHDDVLRSFIQNKNQIMTIIINGEEIKFNNLPFLSCWEILEKIEEFTKNELSLIFKHRKDFSCLWELLEKLEKEFTKNELSLIFKHRKDFSYLFIEKPTEEEKKAKKNKNRFLKKTFEKSVLKRFKKHKKYFNKLFHIPYEHISEKICNYAFFNFLITKLYQFGYKNTFDNKDVDWEVDAFFANVETDLFFLLQMCSINAWKHANDCFVKLYDTKPYVVKLIQGAVLYISLERKEKYEVSQQRWYGVYHSIEPGNPNCKIIDPKKPEPFRRISAKWSLSPQNTLRIMLPEDEGKGKEEESVVGKPLAKGVLEISEST